jgi:HTH-type transcriptional regulator/antitoxin HigA
MEAVMDRQVVAEITTHFEALNAFIPLHTLRDAADYDRAVNSLNQLLDAGAANEEHSLAELVDTLGSLISEYDDAHHPVKAVTPVSMLRFLMGQHQVTQSDLAGEIGSQGVVSEILNEKRELNVRQIKALAGRFQVPPSVFI